MIEETIVALTADIVAAHVSNNTIPSTELPTLIRSVYEALAATGKPVPVVDEKRVPAVSVRSSIKPDSITCLECGTKLKMLKRHLSTDHGLTPAEYRARWGLGSDYPLVAPEYAAKRKELAVKIGLGRKPADKAAGAKAPVAKAAAAKAPGKKPGRPRKVPEAATAA